MSTIDNLHKRKLINPPSFLINNVHYEVVMGSIAYGVSSGNSDIDIYGFAIPPKDMIFPHLKGEILGFGRQIDRFEQYQQHHVIDKEARKEYDLSIYSIIKFFQLCMDNNPNMIDSLFVPQRCIVHITKIGNMVREQRKIFLHKGGFYKFKGYAYSQVHKMNIKVPDPNSKRYESILKFGYDIKFGYHVIRLLNEIEQILIEGDLDLERNREQLKSIRRGEWTQEQIVEYFEKKEKELESVYSSSILQHSPNEKLIKNLLLSCLEEHYGSLNKCVVKPERHQELINELENLVNKYK
jgi:predicted nucleotidyltransferase